MKKSLFLTALVGLALLALYLNPCPLNACCENRGDIDHSDGPNPINISDVVWMVDYMFRSGPGPYCLDEANVNGDQSIMDVADLVHLVDFMFRGGPPPVPCPDPISIAVRFGQTKVISKYAISITFDEVSYDQRCPWMTMCFAPAYAEIVITLTGVSGCIGDVYLPIGDNFLEAIGRQKVPIAACGYLFTLTKLAPYPEVDQTIPAEDYVANIEIMPLDPADGSVRDVIPTHGGWVTDQPTQYFLNGLALSGDTLTLDVGHSGGLPHYFSMYMSPAIFDGVSPRQAYLYVVHHGWRDILTAYWEPSFKYSLQPVADLYEEFYGTIEPIEIHVLDSVFTWDPIE